MPVEEGEREGMAKTDERLRRSERARRAKETGRRGRGRNMVIDGSLTCHRRGRQRILAVTSRRRR
jgi:hypothetical protein